VVDLEQPARQRIVLRLLRPVMNFIASGFGVGSISEIFGMAQPKLTAKAAKSAKEKLINN
jgi:hypothetical protein